MAKVSQTGYGAQTKITVQEEGVSVGTKKIINFIGNSLLAELDEANSRINITSSEPNANAHIADGTIHFTEASINHNNIQNIGINTHAQIDTHIADGTIHFTEASINHNNIQNIGINTHAQIDTHIADSSDPHGATLTQTNLNVGTINYTGASRMRAVSSYQLIPNNVYTIIQYHTKTFDNLEEFDTITSRFTAAASGYYLVNVNLGFGSYNWVAGDEMAIDLYINDAIYTEMGAHEVEASGTFFQEMRNSDIIYLNSGDFMDLRVWHNRGANTATSTTDMNKLSIHRLS